jgi:hypothetical protein
VAASELSTLKPTLSHMQREAGQAQKALQSILRMLPVLTVQSLSSTPESFESSTNLITGMDED